jgi:hypothetical protein
MSSGVVFVRTIDIFVRDRQDRTIPGAKIQFTRDGILVGEVTNAEGRARIELPDRTCVIGVSTSYNEETQTVKLAQAQDSFTFKFDVDVGPMFMEKHIALFVGLGLFVTGIALAFIFRTINPLQHHIILGTFSLGGGAIATEISGMVKVDISVGNAIAIGATGALAIFVILYMVAPA